MYGKNLSREFIEVQKRDRKGINNPMYGVEKSESTLKKLQKLIYVYDSETKVLLLKLPTVECVKHLKMGKDTLYKYINKKIPYKGKLFSHVPLD